MCQIYNVKYIKDTQNYSKEGFIRHFSEISKLVRTRRKLDTFGDHFAKQMNSKDLHAKDVNEIGKSKILWKGIIFNLTKTFSTMDWTLSLQENVNIVH